MINRTLAKLCNCNTFLISHVTNSIWRAFLIGCTFSWASMICKFCLIFLLSLLAFFIWLYSELLQRSIVLEKSLSWDLAVKKKQKWRHWNSPESSPKDCIGIWKWSVLRFTAFERPAICRFGSILQNSGKAMTSNSRKLQQFKPIAKFTYI